MKNNAIHEYIDKNKTLYVDQLIEVLKIPSISALPEHYPDLMKSAQWYQKQLDDLGFETEIFDTPGNPIVFAQRCHHPGAPTVMFYGHHDVQPVDPLEEWTSPPFDPAIKGDTLFARGVSDDKGQIFTAIKAVEAIIEVTGDLPVNVKFIIEGAEESGSRNFADFIEARKDKLATDSLMILDTSQYEAGIPAITYALRGNLYMQIDVQGPAFDLHSGGFGGAVVNPVQALVQMLDQMKGKDHKITVPGFYEDVLAPEEWEKKEFANLPFDEEKFKKFLGVDELAGEPGYNTNENLMIRPTFDVCGIWGGFSGAGSKTIIPAKAGAKISTRLVPNQDPHKIFRLFEELIKKIKPDGVTVKLTKIQGINPLIVDKNQPSYRAMHKAIEEVFGKAPVYIRCGGSIGVANMMREKLGIEGILITGWGSPEDNAHSPNEHQNLEDLHKGIHVCAVLVQNLNNISE